MSKLGPLKRGYWIVEFPTGGGINATLLPNGPSPGMNDWVRLWCDESYLEGTGWDNLKIAMNDKNKPTLVTKCECVRRKDW